jgi:hypothetical protein
MPEPAEPMWTEPVRTLLDTAPPLALTRGGPPGAGARRLLASAAPRDWFPHARAPEAALAGLWLRHGGWQEAHEIAQDLATPEGSYWHAIIHRLEPDAWNAGYWFRRVGAHPLFPALAGAAASLADQHPDAAFRPPASWDPYAFVDFCEAVRARPDSPGHKLALAIQDAEWRLLFDWCARANMK